MSMEMPATQLSELLSTSLGHNVDWFIVASCPLLYSPNDWQGAP